MSETLRRVVELVKRGELLISAHGYDELAEDGILASEAVAGVGAAVLIEDYPEYAKGRCALVLLLKWYNSRDVAHKKETEHDQSG